jgi:hypothetical protein
MQRGVNAELGQGIVEFAVIFPLFVILIFVMIDGGLLMGNSSRVHHAVSEGARLGAIGASKTDIRDRVADQSHGLIDSDTPEDCGTRNDEVCILWFDGPNGEPAGQVGSLVRVSVHYHYFLVTPLGHLVDSLDWLGFGNPDTFHFSVDGCSVAILERPVVGGASSSGDADDADADCNF